MSNETESLSGQLLNGNPSERLAAAERLATLGSDAAPASVALVSACNDAMLRDTCVGALEELGPPPSSEIAALAALAKSETELVAYWAVTLLGRSGSAAGPYKPELEALVQNSDSDAVRKRASWAMDRVL